MSKSQHMRTIWSRQHFNLLVLDEGHKIKGFDTLISQGVRKIHAEMRIILTGTPLANNLVELYSLLSFLCPDVFTTPTPFEEAFNLTLNIVDPVKLGQAHRLLSVLMLRRLKTEVEKLLPRKIETKVVCPLSTTQIWWYKAMLLKDISLLARDSGGGKGRAGMLNNLVMQLRKVCLHPFLFPGAEGDVDSTTLDELVGASGKLSVLDQLLRSLFQKGHRVCLFSQFTSILDILEDYCQMRGWKFCRFDGGTSRAKRNFVINNFNAPESDKFVFLMSTRSGGMGLNLQTADTVILFDSDWNPQPDIQACARVHRIGQKKTVHVYRLVTQGTVEERMVERAEKKLYLDRMVCRDGVTQDLEDEEEEGKLMAALRFGCNAIFGSDSKKQSLPTQEDIELITDRSRSEGLSDGKLKGGTEMSAEEFDATKEFTSTTNFGGIGKSGLFLPPVYQVLCFVNLCLTVFVQIIPDFKKIRDGYKKNQLPDNVNAIANEWRKRQRKSRIKIMNGTGSGYGTAVPVLAMNDYCLETGERSVFQQELCGRGGEAGAAKKKKTPSFDNQDHCQVCGDGGTLLMCGRCPCSVHAQCIGITNLKQFMCCPHHHCAKCGLNTTQAGGFLFVCSTCPNAFCEDCVPPAIRILETCERMESLGHRIKHGTYIHCSAVCENVAIQEFDWSPPKSVRGPCPPALDVSRFFGGEVDDAVVQPDNLIVTGKRQRHPVEQANSKDKAKTQNATVFKPTDAEAKYVPDQAASNDDDDFEDDDDDDDYVPAAGSYDDDESMVFFEEYDAKIPLTPSGLLLKLAVAKDGSTEFKQYTKFPGKCNKHLVAAFHCAAGQMLTFLFLLLCLSANLPDGSQGPAERGKLIRNVGDRIVAIDGESVRGMSADVVHHMLRDCRKQSFVTIRFQTKPNVQKTATLPDSLVLAQKPIPAKPAAKPTQIFHKGMATRVHDDGSLQPLAQLHRDLNGVWIAPTEPPPAGYSWNSAKGSWLKNDQAPPDAASYSRDACDPEAAQKRSGLGNTSGLYSHPPVRPPLGFVWDFLRGVWVGEDKDAKPARNETVIDLT